MNTKRLMKKKAEGASQEEINPKSFKLAETTLASVSKDIEEFGLATNDKKVIDQIGQLTRTLHDSLRELGYDKRLELIAAEVPEAQDKLTYWQPTEQAGRT